MLDDIFTRGGLTRIVHAINVSPESFYKGSVADDAQEGLLGRTIQESAKQGAAIIDIGAMSTAPYKETWITPEEETRRMTAAVRAARGESELVISADTQRAAVACAALDEGAHIVNDVSGLLGDEQMGPLIAERRAGVVLMANDDPELDEAGENPEQVVLRLLREATERALSAGIPRSRIILDPGVGFFRHRSIPWHEWDLQILRNLGLYKTLDCPIMVGASRKSMFKAWLGRERADDRLAGSLAVAYHCAQQGIEWLRVHDVAPTMDVLRTYRLLES